MGIKSSLSDLVIDLDNHWDRARLKLLQAVGGSGCTCEGLCSRCAG